MQAQIVMLVGQVQGSHHRSEVRERLLQDESRRYRQDEHQLMRDQWDRYGAVVHAQVEYKEQVLRNETDDAVRKSAAIAAERV